MARRTGRRASLGLGLGLANRGIVEGYAVLRDDVRPHTVGVGLGVGSGLELGWGLGLTLPRGALLLLAPSSSSSSSLR